MLDVSLSTGRAQGDMRITYQGFLNSHWVLMHEAVTVTVELIIVGSKRHIVVFG